MCLAIPGKLIEIAYDAQGVKMGKANFGGIVKQVCLEYTPEANPGDYVLVHVGFALGKVDEEEAARTTNSSRKWISYPNLKFRSPERRNSTIQ
jgi:hydrogenase expression/formation protein HypC